MTIDGPSNAPPVAIWYTCGRWYLRCPCAFVCEAATVEWLGRQYDVHLAERFPLHSERHPCARPDRPLARCAPRPM